MSKSESSANTSGSIIAGMLGVAFVVLKLCGVINWSWWWVTAPFWGALAIFLAAVLVVAIVLCGPAVVAGAAKRLSSRNTKGGCVMRAMDQRRESRMTLAQFVSDQERADAEKHTP